MAQTRREVVQEILRLEIPIEEDWSSIEEEIEELIAYLDERFRESSRQIEGFRDETFQRFERLEDEVHQTRILVEKMKDTIASGVAYYRSCRYRRPAA